MTPTTAAPSTVPPWFQTHDAAARWERALAKARAVQPRITFLTESMGTLAFGVAGSDAESYRVNHYEDGSLDCGCPSGLAGRPCYHAAAVVLYQAGERPLDCTAPRPFGCIHCGLPVSGPTDLRCRRCQDDAVAANLPAVPTDLQDAKTILPFPTPAPALCTNCQDEPALDGDDLCPQCAADLADAEAQYHPEFPAQDTRIYAETRRDVLSPAAAYAAETARQQTIQAARYAARVAAARAESVADRAAGIDPLLAAFS